MRPLFALVILAAPVLSLKAEKLPLDSGNTWTYRSTDGRETFTIRVGSPVAMQSGRVYYSLSGYTDERILARIDEQGNLVALNEETEAEALVTGFNVAPEEPWPASGRMCVQEGRVRKGTVSHNGLGGRWGEAVEIAYHSPSCADAGIEAEQFADNVGMIRRVASSFAGPRVFDLVHARVGTMTVEPVNRGRFTVSVIERADGAGWDATLRLDLGQASNVRLGFPSAQEFEAVLRDQAGKALWSWSDGKVFAQEIHEKNFGNLWTATVMVPRPISADGPAENLTVEGWLTTSDGYPRFAATAPLPPPAVRASLDQTATATAR
jgi:hypothetical protein